MGVGAAAAVFILNADNMLWNLLFGAVELPIFDYQTILDVIRDPNTVVKPTTYPPISIADPKIVQAIQDNHYMHNLPNGTHRHPVLMSEQEKLRHHAIMQFKLDLEHQQALARHEEEMQQWRKENGVPQ